MKIIVRMRNLDKLATSLSRRLTAKSMARAKKQARKLNMQLAMKSDTLAGVR